MRVPILSKLLDYATKSAVVDSRSLSEFFRIGSESESGANVTPETAMRQSTVYQCNKVIAESIGQMPFNIYQRSPIEGKDGAEYRIAHDHPLQELMHYEPNHFMTSQEMDELIVTHQSFRGNSFWFMNKNTNGRIVEILPLNPSHMKLELVDGWTRKYTYTDQKNGSTQVFGADEIWHVKHLSNNGYWGMTPIAQVKNSIGFAMTMEKHGSKMFKNYARPQGAFKTAKIIPEAEREGVKASLNDQYGGDNTGSIGFLEGDLEWVNMSMTNTDTQYLEMRKFTREDIAATWRVPVHMVGDMSSSTNNNIEHQTLSLLSHTLRPWMERKSKSGRQSLLSAQEKEDGYFFDFESDEFIVRDLKSRAEAHSLMIMSGTDSPNDIRALRRLNPYDGGSDYVKPRSPNEPKPEAGNTEAEGESNED